MILHEIFCYFSCYTAENRFPLEQCAAFCVKVDRLKFNLMQFIQARLDFCCEYQILVL